MADDQDKANASDNKAASLPRGLLGKGGTPVSKSTRLPSVRAARDLTLGGAQRKSFKPNIPVRPKDKAPSTPVEDKLVTKQKRSKRERGDKGNKNRSKEPPAVIQSTSIFEQGLSEKTIKKEKLHVGYKNEDGNTRQSVRVVDRRPVSDSHAQSTSGSQIQQNRDETQRILDELLRDDFVDDSDDELTDATSLPVTLPLLDVNSHINTDLKPSNKPMDQPSLVNSYDPTKSGHIFDLNNELQDLLLVQLPDCLPGLTSEPDGKARIKTEPSQHQQPEMPLNSESDLSKMTEKCNLSDLTEGCIGKLQIMKSGKTRLVLGNIKFDICRGAPCGFLQELVCVDTKESDGTITCLGPVKEKLVVVPDIDNLLD